MESFSKSHPLVQLRTGVLVVLAIVVASACSAYPQTPADLVFRSVDAVREKSVEKYTRHMMTVDALIRHCGPGVVLRARETLPYRRSRVADSISSCRSIASWKRVELLALEGGDVSESPRECGGHFQRLSDVSAVFVVDGRRVRLTLGAVYRRRDGDLLVGKQPVCRRD